MLAHLFSTLALLGSANLISAAPPEGWGVCGSGSSPSPSASPSPSPTSSPSASTVPSPSATTTGPGNGTPSDTPSPRGLSLGSTFLYELDRTNIDVPSITSDTGVEVNADVYLVDLENHSASELQRYKDAGKIVMCYFSAGTWEPWRADRYDFNTECYCGPGVEVDDNGTCIGEGSEDNLLGEWGEWWLDLNSPACRANVHEVQRARIRAARAKGCDGLDPDNVDSDINQQTHGNTQEDQYDYLTWLADAAHEEGLLIGLKNSAELVDHDVYGPILAERFDFGVIESCNVWSECHMYDRFLEYGKPQIQIEYVNRITSCPDDTPFGRNLAVYSGLTLDTRTITLDCPTSA